MARNFHFKNITDWKEAKDHIDFEPRIPSFTAGYSLHTLSVYVVDHRKRQLPISSRSLSAYYDQAFVIEQKRLASSNEARRTALSISYGSAAQTIFIAGHEGRKYELGPEVPTTDIDGRMPAVIAWSEENNIFLLFA